MNRRLIESDSLLSRVDHLVYAVPNLHAGIERIESLLGIRATSGGQHPGAGTRNALIALGTATYLEIIGPDPEQPTFRGSRLFGIDTLAAPKLVTWAANATDLERLAARDLGGGVRLGEVRSGSRQTSEGLLLSWRFTHPGTVVAGGIVPFFIDWGETRHPARTAAQSAVLVELRSEHPEPEPVKGSLKKLELNLPVSKGPAPALVASIDSPRGRVILR